MCPEIFRGFRALIKTNIRQSVRKMNILNSSEGSHNLYGKEESIKVF